MADTCCDMTHRAYELALGEGLGFWERSATVTSCLTPARPRSGLRSVLGGRGPRSGALMLHVFDGGLVVERHKGGVLGTAYDAVSATLLDIEQPDSGPSAALNLTFDGSRTLLMTGSAAEARGSFTELAGRCGASTRARVSRAEAEQAFAAPDWI